MPCRTDYIDDHEFAARKEASLTKAALCAVLHAMFAKGIHPFEDPVIDWKEAGVTKKELRTWWINHLREDEVRKEREAKEKQLKEEKRAALAKLTPKERALLGLKTPLTLDK